MLRALCRAAPRGVVAPRAAAALPRLARRGLADDAVGMPAGKGSSHPYVPEYGQPTTMQEEAYVYEELVLEEQKTGFPPGLPMKRDSEIWAQDGPNQLIAERAELWWDDGTAEPEWFVDRGSAGGADGGRPWVVSNAEAVGQLLGMFSILGGVMVVAYALNERLRPAAPKWVHGYPVDMHEQFGLGKLPKDGSKANNGAKRVAQVGADGEVMEPPEDEE